MAKEKHERPGDDELEKYYNTTKALEVAEAAGIRVTRVTLIAWVEKHGLGFQLGGPDSSWWIDKAKFDEFIGQKGGSHGAAASN